MSNFVHCVMGLDPGKTGGLAFYYPGNPMVILAEDMPIAGGEVDAVTLAARLKQIGPTMAVVEAVHSMPGQGVASSFSFGVSYGTARGVILALGIPCHLVTPNRWKRYFHLDSDKEKSRALALRFWPTSTAFSRKKDEARAEGALLARYGAEVILGQGAAD